MECPHCGSESRKNGKAQKSFGQRYKCKNPDCQYEFTIKFVPSKTSANILILDIETAPMTAFVWSMWKNNIGKDQLISDWYCLTWAAKWIYEDEVYSGKLTAKEAKEKDDKRIMYDLWHFINAADIVIAHNAIKFDVPKMNTRFLIHNFAPPAPYQIIDTLKEAKKTFKHSSNRLDFINTSLGIEGKIDTDMSLWVGCVEGNSDSLRDMETYNKNDVVILEKHYLKIRPWIKSHPNIGVYVDSDTAICPNCGSHDIKWEDKFYHTTANKFSIFRCNNCGAIGRSRETAMSKQERQNLVIPIAR